MRRGDLVRFDVTAGAPTAVRVLHRHLGTRQALRALGHYVRRSVTRDPLRDLDLGPWPRAADRASRHQFRQVVMLDDVLREDLHVDRFLAEAVVRDVVAATGARFLAAQVSLPDSETWRAASPAERDALATGIVGRFFNTQTDGVRTSPDTVAFDVTACRFVQLATALGRPDLAGHFCAADSAFFDAGTSPVTLVRTGTLADGAPCCDFRFRWS